MVGKIALEMKGVAGLRKALSEVGAEVAREAGKKGNRRAIIYMRKELKSAAPVNPKGPTKKTWKLKNGERRTGFYGRLRDNIRYVAGRKSTRYDNTYYGVVGIGNAFWGTFTEKGTKRGVRPTKWFSRTIERVAPEALRIQTEGVRDAISKATRKLRK